ncbi:tyrosine-type recombinase/integrase [Marinactinospora rubrisoli]|uniref:Tyrosine-type recombinase/integrase n=1 Tax=Marinactinospora rubrisoli TaxID=2715399 RepID=A0ABW2KQV5_9ACTN
MSAGEIVPAAAGAPVWQPGVDLAALETAEAMRAAADAIIAASTRPNTAAAFAQDWRHWTRFCVLTGADPLEVSADALVVFAGWLAREPGDGRYAAPATIERRITGVLHHWRHAGRTVPARTSVRARQEVRRYAQRLAEQGIPVGRGQAPFLTVAQLRAICSACPPGATGARDRALVLIGFGIAARRSELAGLDADDIALARDEAGELLGLRVRVRTSKTGQGRQVAIARGSSALTCPARAWQDWQRIGQVDAGPAFRRVTRHDAVQRAGLSPASAGEVVRRAGERAGVPELSGHSLRAGLATAARLAGHDIVAIARIGGWSPGSKELMRYLRIADEWSHADNATIGIGL